MPSIQPLSAPVLSLPSINEVRIPAGSVLLHGELVVPADCNGVVVFAHGSGSSRHSPRDRAIAAALRTVGLATLMFDLRTPEEESLDRMVGWLRSDPILPGQRIAHATRWVEQQPALRERPIGYFGAGTGAAAALLSASWLQGEVAALVCRSARTDLVEDVLGDVRAPTLLLAGERDPTILGRNREALPQFGGEKELAVIEGASHMFREPGALDAVASRASTWFRGFLADGFAVH